MAAALAGALAFTCARAAAAAAEPVVTHPPANPGPNWQLDTTITGQRYSFQSPTAGTSSDGLQGNADLEVIKFDAPLQDDGAPYSLEPFLQHRSQWSLSVGAGHFDTRDSAGGPDLTGSSGGLGMAMDAYLTPAIALTGDLGYGFSVAHSGGADRWARVYSGSLGLGVRAEDSRFDLTYSFSAEDLGDSFAPLRQTVSLSAYTVIGRRLAVSLYGAIIPDGHEADLSATYYPERALGIFAGGGAEDGVLDDDGPDATRYFGWVGLTAWLGGRVGVTAEYELHLERDRLDDDVYDTVDHILLIGASLRFSDL